MPALLENEFVIRRKWISKEDFLTMTAISESTPGPMAVNSATYLGYQMGGFAGALTATIAVCYPGAGFLLILVFLRFLLPHFFPCIPSGYTLPSCETVC